MLRNEESPAPQNALCAPIRSRFLPHSPPLKTTVLNFVLIISLVFTAGCVFVCVYVCVCACVCL